MFVGAENAVGEGSGGDLWVVVELGSKMGIEEDLNWVLKYIPPLLVIDKALEFQLSSTEYILSVDGRLVHIIWYPVHTVCAQDA